MLDSYHVSHNGTWNCFTRIRW